MVWQRDDSKHEPGKQQIYPTFCFYLSVKWPIWMFCSGNAPQRCLLASNPPIHWLLKFPNLSNEKNWKTQPCDYSHTVYAYCSIYNMLYIHIHIITTILNRWFSNYRKNLSIIMIVIIIIYIRSWHMSSITTVSL